MYCAMMISDSICHHVGMCCVDVVGKVEEGRREIGRGSGMEDVFFFYGGRGRKGSGWVAWARRMD